MLVPGSVNPLLMAAGGDPLDDLGVVERSVRFRQSAGSYFGKTPVSAGNRVKWTWCALVKRGAIPSGTSMVLFDATTNATNVNWIGYRAGSNDDSFGYVQTSGGSAIVRKECAPLQRDPASHAFLLVSYDSANPTAADRVKLEINGVRITSFLGTNTDPSLSLNSLINNNQAHRIGSNVAGVATGHDGYMSNVSFVDGQSLSSSAFGQFHPRTGQWRPYSKSRIRANVAAGGGARNGWGQNGFFLPFDDVTSLTTLGYDRSQSDTDTTGNNWTANNISLTAGVTYDSMLDTPTNNFCTWNPLAQQAFNGGAGVGSFVATNGNLYASDANASNCVGYIPATILLQDFDIYAEFTYVNRGGAFGHIGVVRQDIKPTALPDSGIAGYYTVRSDGQKNINGTFSAFTTAQATNDVLSFIWTASSRTLEVWKNGVSQGNLVTGLPAGDFAFCYADGQNPSTNTVAINAGQQPFVYTPPAGAKTLSTKDFPILPAGPIKSTDAFVAVTDTGANIQATLAAARPNFGSYIDIIKRRDAAEGWRWIFSDDPTNYLDTSTTNAKAALPAFGGTSYAGYSLKVAAANGVATGTFVHTNGVDSVIADGLSNSRKMVILHRESAGGGAFFAYHPDLTAGRLMYLNTTGTEAVDASINTVTAGGFTAAAALPSGTYRWISLAEVEGFLKLGKRTGNASTDGSFANSGLSPAFNLERRVNTGTWNVFDRARNPNNVIGEIVYLEKTDAGATFTLLDDVSNGAKMRTAGGNLNESDNFIYLHIAAFPFRYANAR